MKKTVLAAAGCIALLSGAAALASSHREAPFITENPKVDGTDFYMFRSYESGRAGFVTLIANYVPLQDAYGGPNYFSLDPDALYEIHVDNNGDAVEDITFAFRFTNTFTPLQLDTDTTSAVNSVSIPLINSGQITTAGDSDLHVKETYSVAVIRGGRRSTDRTFITNPIPVGTDSTTTFRKPVDNIGNKSIPDYNTYANSHISSINIPGCSTTGGKVFVGQRREGFVVNLGEVFDLINTNPLGARNAELNVLDDKNITSIALEVPAACLTAGNDSVIGAWTTASLRQTRVLNPRPQSPVTNRPGTTGPALEGGAFTQVSRLGSPLVNEVVIGLDRKDRFNSSQPKDDVANFGTFVLFPTLPKLVEILFSVPSPATPRNDLLAAFVTGIRTSVNGTMTNFTQPAAIAAGTGTAGEMLRLNTAFPTAVTAVAPAPSSDLGFLACDLNGFPNGRRVTDDVVDIELTVAEGALSGTNGLQTCDVSGPAPTVVAGAVVTDGAQPVASDAKGAFYLSQFPYLATPLPGSPAN